MSNTIEIKDFGGGVIFDKDGNAVGKYVKETGRGMFSHAFFEDVRTCTIEKTGYATVICSSCGGEYCASICTNIPPDYVGSAKHCPCCGARIVKKEEAE